VLILLPPSEGKTAPRRGHPLRVGSLSFPALEENRTEVLDALISLCTTDPAAAARTLGLGPTQAGQVAHNAGLRTAPTGRGDAVYSGVLYEAVDLPGLTGAARRRATQWVAVTSSLFGVLRPADRIPAYRLAGNVALPGLGTVSTYWSKRLDPTLTQAAGRGLVVDLRSSTYAAFWRPAPSLAARVVTVRVLHEHNGTRKVVSHFNKSTKGRLVRALLTDGRSPTSPVGFADLLTDLGWKVEDGPQAGVLDVIVQHL